MKSIDPGRIRDRLRPIRIDPWYRIIRHRHCATPLGAIPSPSRFNDVTHGFWVVYAARSLRCAVLETLVRDEFTHRQKRELPRARVEERILVTLSSTADLLLVDLRGDGTTRIGIPTAVARDSNHRAGRAFSRFTYQMVPEADGFVYSSRYSGDDCIAVFDRANSKLQVEGVAPLTEFAAFWEILESYEVRLGSSKPDGSR